MNKYTFAEGGDATGAEQFNQYFDQLTSAQQQTTDNEQQEPVAQPEESDFIKGLRASDDEETSNSADMYKELLGRIDGLQAKLDEQSTGHFQQQMEKDWFADDDNTDGLANQYNTQNSSANSSHSTVSDSDLMAGIGKGESGNNYFIGNPQAGQSAYGKYQFTNAAQKDAFNAAGGANKYGSFENYQKLFKSTPSIQEEAMTSRINQAKKVVGNDPVALALYHYAPKFALMYKNGQLDLNKNPASYGVGKGVNNPSFKSFLDSHGLKGQY